MGIEILAFGAHPDDVECAASGVILNTVAQGGKVVLVDMTKGEMGTFGDETLRAREGEAARRATSEDLPFTLLESGLDQRVHAESGVNAPVDMRRVASTRAAEE